MSFQIYAYCNIMAKVHGQKAWMRVPVLLETDAS